MTSISDRCKTAREKATPGPWRHGDVPGPGEDPMRSTEVYPQDGYGVIAYVQPDEADVSLIALAPEAADEVVRLTAEFEALAEWHDSQAALKGDTTPTAMAHKAAAARIRNILDQGDTDDMDHP